MLDFEPRPSFLPSSHRTPNGRTKIETDGMSTYLAPIPILNQAVQSIHLCQLSFLVELAGCGYSFETALDRVLELGCGA